MTDITIIQKDEISEFLQNELILLALDFASKASSSNTKKTYAYGWKCFSDWCSIQGIDPMKAEAKEVLISLFITYQASKGKLKVSSITCYIAGIRSYYLDRGVVLNMQHPALKNVLKGIRNTLSKRPIQKDPLLVDELREMVQAIPRENNGKRCLKGLRDRALLLLGFSGAFRRSELVYLNFEDLVFTRDGFIALLRKSKTDQEGQGIEKAIPYGSNPHSCPVRAMKDWLEASMIQSGPIFSPVNRHGQILDKRLTAHSVALIVKRSCSGDSSRVSGHSLRAGFVTSAAKKKIPEHLIMKQTGHKCSDTLKRYIRLATCFDENASALVGL